MPLQTFRYAACGGSVALLNLFIFFLANQFLFKSTENGRVQVFDWLSMETYTACFIIALCVSFPIGFALNKYVVFTQSHLRGRIQLFRYGLSTGVNIFLNWGLLHFFAGFLGFWATPSQAITTFILAIFSYFTQQHFSFRSKKPVAISKNELTNTEIE